MSRTSNNGRIRVLICLEFRSYSEAIGCVIGSLRPDLQVRVAEPDTFHAEIDSFEPDLVLCSQPRCLCHPSHDPEESGGPSWIEFYPYANPRDRFVVNGVPSETEEVDLDYLLSVIDELVRKLPNTG